MFDVRINLRFDVRINLRFDVCLPLPLPRLASVTSEYPITKAQYPMSKVKRALRGEQAGRTTDNSFAWPGVEPSYLSKERTGAGWLQMAVARGTTRAVRALSFKRNLRKSPLAWMPNQKRGDWLKNFPSRIDISAVMDRRPSTISLTVRGETPSPRASAFCDRPSGLRYSSRRISPGVIGFMGISYSVMG